MFRLANVPSAIEPSHPHFRDEEIEQRSEVTCLPFDYYSYHNCIEGESENQRGYEACSRPHRYKVQSQALNPQHLSPEPGLKHHGMSPLSGAGMTDTLSQVIKSWAYICHFHLYDNRQVTHFGILQNEAIKVVTYLATARAVKRFEFMYRKD